MRIYVAGWAKKGKKTGARRAAWNAYHREYRKKNRAKILKAQRKWNKSERGKRLKKAWHLNRYGVTIEQYEAMWVKQKRRCGICGTRKPKRIKGRGHGWHLDHCHRTGKFRGILCIGCNLGIGFLNDDPRILKNAVKYLRKR